MSIVVNGTTIKKLFVNGAEKKEGYANSVKVFSAQEIVFNGTTLASGYKLTTFGGNSSTVGLFYAKPRYNDSGSWWSQGCAFIPIDCSNYSKITVTYECVGNTYGWVAIGLSNVRLTSGNYGQNLLDSPLKSIAKINGESKTVRNTATVDISSITGTKYLAVGAYNTQGNQTDAIITKVILE